MENLPVSVMDMLSGLEQIAGTEPSEGIVFMKMLKVVGTWVFGQDNDEIEEGSQWMIDPRETQAGFVCWGLNGGAPLGEEMGGGKRPPIDRNILGEHSDVNPKSKQTENCPWDVQKSIQMICVSGSDAGTAVLYKTNSKGGLTCISRIIQDVTSRARAGNPQIFPVVTLHHTTGDSNWGPVAYPELKQVEWLTVAEFDEAVSGADEVEALPEPEPEPVAATPIRRKRKRT